MTNDDQFFKDILDHLYDGVYFVDRRRRITYWNKGAERITGFSGEAVIGRCCADSLLMHVDELGTQLCQGQCPLVQTIQDSQPREVEVYLRHADGHRVPVLVRAAPLCDRAGEVVGAVESFSDNSLLTATRRQAEQLAQAVEQDGLTKVGTRTYLERKLQACLAEFGQGSLPFGVLFIDLDHFKEVNDRYGHDVGDQVLRMVAETLRQSIRASDFIGRWGGEEFVVLLLEVDQDQLARVANKLRALVERSHFSVGDNRIATTVSVGATLSHVDDTAEAILKRADHLLYLSKWSGRNRVSFSA